MAQKENHLKEINNLQEQIFYTKNYISCLLKRLSLIKIGYANKDSFERNEIEILILDTKHLLNHKTDLLAKLESKLKSKVDDYDKMLEEVAICWDKLIHNVMSFHQDRLEVKDYLYPINWKQVSDNIDYKIEVYYNLKKLIGD